MQIVEGLGVGGVAEHNFSFGPGFGHNLCEIRMVGRSLSALIVEFVIYGVVS